MPVVIPATHAYPHLVFPANTTNHAPPVLFPIERPTTTILVVAHGGVRTRRERERLETREGSQKQVAATAAASPSATAMVTAESGRWCGSSGGYC
ncbi:hypothetical protein HanPSC8_Chr01g0006721 [Helianthus annuus]|nr:hypothetical protein HanPSC8_Chr01g0006721 [Helianthus annuus]